MPKPNEQWIFFCGAKPQNECPKLHFRALNQTFRFGQNTPRRVCAHRRPPELSPRISKAVIRSALRDNSLFPGAVAFFDE
jgi:hypothetical protein